MLVKAIAIALATLVIGGCALRAIHNDYAFFLVYLVLQYVALALGWNVLGGYAGFVNFGAAAFFASGAYATVALNKALAAPLPVCVLVGAGVGAALGLAMGALTLRLRGVYFAISTLSLSVMLETLIVNWHYVGGTSGAYLMRPKSFAPFSSYTEYLCLWMFVIAAVAAIGSALIERSDIGAGLAAIRDDEVAAAALGAPTLRLKVSAAAISGAILGAAGAPLPFYNSFINPETAFAAILNASPTATSCPNLFFDFGGWLGLDQGCHEGLPVRKDQIGGYCSDVLEEAGSGALGLSGGDPQFLGDVAGGVKCEGEEVQGCEDHGEMLLAMTEIMFEVISVVFQDVESFVLDFPPRPGAGGDLGDIFAADVQACDPGAIVGRLALGVEEGQADPIDAHGVLAFAQRSALEPAVAIGQLLAAFLARDRHFLDLGPVHEVVQRLVGIGLGGEEKLMTVGHDELTDRLAGEQIVA